MLVYSGTIWLSNNAETDSALGVIASWLSRKTHSDIPIEFLKTGNQKRTSDGMQIFVSRTHSVTPFMECVKLTHGDKDIRGRQWTTEIGLRRDDINSEIECSILLKVDDVSPRVEGKIQPTVPYLLHDFIKKCSPSAKTVGLSILSLDDLSETEAFAYSITHPNRQHPFILVSPTPTDDYLVNIDTLKFFLEGTAEVIIIPIGANTFKMGEIMGSQYIAWGGAVNIIFPEVSLHGTRFCPTKRLTPDVLKDIDPINDNREREILSIVTHRTNLPNSWRHISFEKVAEQIQKDERKRLRDEAAETGKTAVYADFLENYASELEQKLSALEQKLSTTEAQVDQYEILLLESDDDNRQLRHKIDDLNLSLSHAPTEAAEIPDYVEKLLDSVSRYMTPKESLTIISNLYADRIVILDSAWKSADVSFEFREKKQAFQLLWKLSTDYWLALANGQGDVEARKAFGKNEYASNEGETAGSNKRSQEARTFQYKGEYIEMMKHLKHGIKDSAVETIRIHFEWDADDKKIVIGYCGPHLPHK